MGHVDRFLRSGFGEPGENAYFGGAGRDSI